MKCKGECPPHPPLLLLLLLILLLFIDCTHVYRRRLVWSDFGDSKLEQLFFNGSSRSVIPGVPDGYVQQPGPVAVRSDGHTYWANSKIGASQPAEIRGTNGFLDRLGSTVTVKGLAFLGTKLYWTETGSEGGRLMKRDDVDVELASGLHGVSGLVAVDTSSKGQ